MLFRSKLPEWRMAFGLLFSLKRGMGNGSVAAVPIFVRMKVLTALLMHGAWLVVVEVGTQIMPLFLKDRAVAVVGVIGMQQVKMLQKIKNTRLLLAAVEPIQVYLELRETLLQ